MPKVCIICEKEPGENAWRVKEDVVIRIIRTFKQRLGIAKNNELYVCESCLSAYREKRKKFERNIVLWVAIGVIVFAVLNGMQIINGRFSVVAFIASILLVIVVAGLAMLNYYTPPLEESSTVQSTEKPIVKEESKKKEALRKQKK